MIIPSNIERPKPKASVEVSSSGIKGRSTPGGVKTLGLKNTKMDSAMINNIIAKPPINAGINTKNVTVYNPSILKRFILFICLILK